MKSSNRENRCTIINVDDPFIMTFVKFTTVAEKKFIIKIVILEQYITINNTNNFHYTKHVDSFDIKVINNDTKEDCSIATQFFSSRVMVS